MPTPCVGLLCNTCLIASQPVSVCARVLDFDILILVIAGWHFSEHEIKFESYFFRENTDFSL